MGTGVPGAGCSGNPHSGAWIFGVSGTWPPWVEKVRTSLSCAWGQAVETHSPPSLLEVSSTCSQLDVLVDFVQVTHESVWAFL